MDWTRSASMTPQAGGSVTIAATRAHITLTIHDKGYSDAYEGNAQVVLLPEEASELGAALVNAVAERGL